MLDPGAQLSSIFLGNSWVGFVWRRGRRLPTGSSSSNGNGASAAFEALRTVNSDR